MRLQVISDLADTDAPQLFSLPANISRAAAQSNSERVVASLKAMSAAQAAAAGFNRAQWSVALGPLLRLWDTLMASATGLKQVRAEIHKYTSYTRRTHWIHTHTLCYTLHHVRSMLHTHACAMYVSVCACVCMCRDMQAAKEVRGAGRASRAGDGGGAAKGAGPVDSFVALERAACVGLVDCVNRTLTGIARVLKGQDTLSSTVQVRLPVTHTHCTHVHT